MAGLLFKKATSLFNILALCSNFSSVTENWLKELLVVGEIGGAGGVDVPVLSFLSHDANRKIRRHNSMLFFINVSDYIT
jgi:hypothetical protein